MAEDDSSKGYNLQDPSSTFTTVGSAPADLTSNPSTNPDDAFQNYFDDTSWPYQDADNVHPTASMGPDQSGLMASPWGFNIISQHPQPIDAQGFMQSPLPSFYSTQPPQHVQSRFGQPRPGLNAQAPMPGTLTPTAQEHLRNIAMPPSLQYKSPKSTSSPGSAVGWTKLESLEPPNDELGPSKGHSKKRKVSADRDEEDDEDDEEGRPVKKNAHNMIEKRYRTNLNDKIAALRESVPSLRIMSKSARGEDTTEDREELHGLTPAHKLNKATILSKTMEYIRHLEKRNERLTDEVQAMQTRITAFEKLFMNGTMNGSMNGLIAPNRQHAPTPIQFRTEYPFTQPPGPVPQESTATASSMIRHPDDMKHAVPPPMAVGQPYPVTEFQGAPNTVIRQQQIRQQRQGGHSRWGNAAPYVGKMMVGSLAGLMLLEAAREEELSSDTPQGRGLFAIPLHTLRSVASSMDVNVAGYHFHTSLKLLLLLGTLIWVFVPSLFAVAPEKSVKQISGTLEAVPSLAVSIDVRRRAWLTAIQTVWVPKHDFILEAAALLLKTVKLSLRNAIGIQAYQKLTGLTEEQETARVKAWSIALDSQLAGGDVEINKSRLILTLLASWTLPDTPLRSMLKAVHIRVLLWDINSLALGFTRAWAAKFARSRWLEARQLNQILVQLRSDPSTKHEDELPDHLAALVELKCDDVLTDEVIQRAYNLAYNLETTNDIESQIDGMDLVVEDGAIASPLDAVAAWCSTQRLHAIITSTMSEDNLDRMDRDESLLTIMRVTPLGSAAELRASAALAFWAIDNRRAQMNACARLIGSDHQASLVHSSTSSVERYAPQWIFDIRHILRCAALIDCIEGELEGNDLPADFPHWLTTIMTPLATSKMSLLGCSAAFEVMEHLYERRGNADTFKHSLESLSGSLRLWIGGASGLAHGMPSAVRHSTFKRCLTITKNLIGMVHDTGCGSMSESEAV